MTPELRERILKTSYTEIVAGDSVRPMLQAIADAINAARLSPEEYERGVEAAFETYFGLKPRELDEPLLRHARAEVERAIRRILSR